MNPSNPDIQDITLNELTGCLQWLLMKMSAERAQWVIAQLTDRVEQQRTREIFAVASRQNGQIVAAVLAIAQPPGAATLLAMADRNDSPDNDPLIQLEPVLARLYARLRAVDVHFLQAAEGVSHGGHLHRLGFTHLADLAFLVLERGQFAARRSASSPQCRFEIVGADPARIAAACELAAQTFVGTRDCPRLSHFRSATEIVDSYRLSHTFDPQLWRLVLRADLPVGCLFLTQHRVRASAGSQQSREDHGAVEISYMGLLLEHRGQGLSRLILNEAVEIAKRLNASRMVLAVDRENLPATSLYQRHGWTEAAHESVWGTDISP